MSALLAHIDTLIAKRGPISVADYMELALRHPEFGYYSKGDPLGREGDFITAPEISQMFGEMIGLWCADVWRQMGKPEEFVLLELGPGRGTLLQDALRATEKIHGFHEAMALHLLECNTTLREMQEEKFRPHLPFFLDDITQLPELPVLAIANEFFDVLPIRQFEKTFQGWHERLVTIEDGKLGFTLAPLDAAMMFLIPQELREANPETVHEVSLSSMAFMRDLAKHVARHSGAALIVDYGSVEPVAEATLQAVAQHDFADVFAHPGEADLTAHVDFGALKSTATANGATAFGPIGQGEFLQNLGIELRADQLKRKATKEQAADITDALQRLVDPSEMGSLFKVLAVTSPRLVQVPGF